ncbi:MAG: uracil-DNA glycosylase [Candidatus Cloacimonetes bacterium]|nr:uracil-DNA glycosylase [Candidatus Cloacimonadota bacterium]
MTEISINPKLHPSWLDVLSEEFQKPYFYDLKRFLLSEKQKGKIIYPPGPLMFSALNLTPFDKVKVVILGQDPYHGPNQAHGLSFSVKFPTPIPPSLANIFLEMQNDLQCVPVTNGDLTPWALEGVLLLNAVLSVEANKAGSHRNRGWEKFTDSIIATLSQKRDFLVFVLWGRDAIQKKALIDSNKHLILQAPHPSPLSAYRGFFGSRPFSSINQALGSRGLNKINWGLDALRN